MVVIYAMGIFKCMKSVNASRIILKPNMMFDMNECVWIVPGTFDTLYN